MATLQEAPEVLSQDIVAMHQEIQSMLAGQRRLAMDRDTAVADAVEQGVAVADLAMCLGVTPGRVFHMKAAGLARRIEKGNVGVAVEAAAAL